MRLEHTQYRGVYLLTFWPNYVSLTFSRAVSCSVFVVHRRSRAFQSKSRARCVLRVLVCLDALLAGPSEERVKEGR